MNASDKRKLNLVDKYLQISCFNKISERTYKDILDYELKADSIEKKIIKRIKDQIDEGKFVISDRETMTA